jgi:filamentous hemagglutinin family protein
MNNACKVIWSHTLQQMVVVSEIVRGRGKAKSVKQGSEPHTASTAINTGTWTAKTLASALALAFGAFTAVAPALSQTVANNALPTGGSLAAGSATIRSSGANMVIDQASQRAILNWQSFNVGQNAQVHFNNAGGSTLNRVTGPEASTIMGRITAPGQVIISNGNGVFFGRGSMVDVGSLIATTHSIGNEQFMAGDLSFERKGSTASVVNEGELRAKLEGYIALVAPEVRNQGLIVATKGTVALAAGEVVELQLDPNNKLTNIRVSAGQWQALVENKQAIEAEGGLVILSAMAARELQGSVVSNSGSINASSLTSVGGRIILTGDAITLKDGSKITATGATGGGQVLVGGDWQGGHNAERRVFDDPMALYQATKLTMEAGATIDASATDKGKGGTVVLWSDIALPNAVTAARGSIQAQGGRQGGDGGQIETSGADLKVDGIQVSTLAPQGQTGEWLLDPRNITIGGSGGSSYTAIADNTQISATTLQTALNTTDVTVFTGTTGSQAGNITVSAPITSASSRTLTLKAQGSIVINSDITRSGTGGLTLRTGSGSVSGTGTLVLGGGTTLSLAHGTTLANKIALTTGGATLNLANLEVEYLLVGGGGGGTSDFWAPGGGGGGGFVTGSTSLSVGSSSSVTVGAGGTAEAAGQASTAFGGTANGGGVASTAFGNARGGSSGNGNSGGASYRELGNSPATGGGGGAGAGGVGQDGAASQGGDGGAGRSSDITGTLRWYAGGGGGAAGVGNAANQGSGTAGGGNGTNTGNGGQNGTGNTGGGGGGVYQGSAGSGGSGIVVARYLGPSAAGTGGSIAASPGSASGYTVHTFTSAGTLTINQLSANLTGEVSGTGNLTVNATGGTLTLGGNSTYTGTTTLSGGVVQADHANALGSNSAVTLGTTAGTRLELLDHLTVGSIAGGSGTNARIELSSYKLTAGGDNTDTSFAGRIAGTSGQLEKAGTGDLTLTAANTYTGATTIAAGRLVIQSNAPDTASSQFKGPGALVIQPEGTDFSSAFSTAPKWNFAADLGGLTIGKETSANGTSDVDVNLGASNSAIRIAGPVKVYGRDVNVNGDLGSTLAGAAIDLQASGNVAQLSGLAVTTTAGHVTYWADSDNNGSGGVTFYMGASGNTTSVSTGGGNIVIGGGTDPLTGNARGTPAGVVMDPYTVLDAGTGSISVRGASTNTGSGLGVLLNTNAELRGGSVTLVGTGASTSGAGSASVGVAISGAITSTGTVTIEGYGGTGTGTGGAHHGVSVGGPGITGNGAVSISGTGGSGGDNNHGVQLSGATVLSNAGALTVTATAGGGGSSRGLFSGSADTLGGAGQSGNITVRADRFNTPASLSITSTGRATVEPLSGSTSFGSAFNSLRFNFAPTLTGLTLGRAGNTAGITLGQAHSISGPITVYGGAIAIEGALSATNGAAPNPTLYNIDLQASGAVTQSAAITAAGLGLNGAGSFTLNHTGNSVGTLAGGSSSARLGSLSFTNATALTVGQVNPTGIWATGNVRVETRSGNLTLGQNINTLSSTSSAVVLAAGASTAAGTSSGGDIVLTAPVTLSMGTGGRATLYTGSLSGSVGLAQANPYDADSDPLTTNHWLIASGTGQFRYGSSESISNFTSALGGGIYAVYRQRPSITGQINNRSMTYGESLPTFTLNTSSGIVNGDSDSGLTVVGATDAANLSGAGLLKVKNVGYSVKASGLEALGYDISGVNSGTLTINTKPLNISGLSGSNKTYDGNPTATPTGTAVLTSGGAANNDGKLVTNDVVSLTGTASAAFDGANAQVGRTATIGGLSLAGADAASYTLNPLSFTADITRRMLTLSATKVYDGNTVLTGSQLTLGNMVGSETLTHTGATVSSKHVATANNFVNAITLGNGTNGGLASNYQLPDITQAAAGVNNVTINAATLAPSISNTGVTKVYDGTTNPPAGFTPTYTFGGLASGDSAATLGFTGGQYNSANVSSAHTLTVAGLSITGISGNNGSKASDYVLDATSKTVGATISAAPLTVRANNDAKFLTQSDTAGFSGVSYSGFVNGETSAVLVGAPAIARTNVGTDTAGTYSGVLQASGLTSSNYAITFANGDFTIVPSSQLLVRVANASSTYGAATQYAIASVEYDNGTSVVRLDNNSVSGASVAISGANAVTVNDGSSGTANFTLDPLSAVTTGAGKLAVGSYQLSTSGTVTENSANFSNVVTVVGAHQVNTKGLSASASGVSKVYDGTTGMQGVTIGLSTLEPGDVVTVNGMGAFGSKNAGSGLNYTISNLALSGAAAASYHLTGGGSFGGSDGVITARPLTVSYTGVDKAYDGNTSTSVNLSDNRVSGDVLVINRSAAFADKNAGAGKTVNVNGVSLSGTDAGNYTVTTTGTAIANITRLNLVTWVGGATGNWFDPANWAGGAVPDLSNVANVIIPSGVIVTFNNTASSPATAANTEANAVKIDSLGSTDGSLQHTEGFLNIGAGGMTLASYNQSGGTLINVGSTNLGSYSQSAGSFNGTGNFASDSLTQTGGTTLLAGNLTVNNSYSQGTAGSVTVGGNTNITDTTGGMAIGNLSTTGTTTIVSTGGNIAQASGTTTSSGGLATINASGNATLITSGVFNAVLNVTGNTSLTSNGNLTVSGSTTGLITTTTGANSTTTFGTTTVGGDLSITSTGNVGQTGPLIVDGSAVFNAPGQQITLTNPGNRLRGGVVTTAATVSVTGDVLSDAAEARRLAALAAARPGAEEAIRQGLLSQASISLPTLMARAANITQADMVSPVSNGSTSVRAAQGVSDVTTPGVQVDVIESPQTTRQGLVAVTLPARSSTSGTGFVFLLPADLVVQFDEKIKVSLENGAPLPAWLRFDTAKGEFSATAVPDRAFPVRVRLEWADQQLFVVISERQT